MELRHLAVSFFLLNNGQNFINEGVVMILSIFFGAIACIVTVASTINIVGTIFKMRPVVNRLIKLSIIEPSAKSSLYTATRILLAVAVLVAIYLIPVPGLTVGLFIGFFIVLYMEIPPTAKGTLEIYSDFMNIIPGQYKISDENKWETLKEYVDGANSLIKWTRSGASAEYKTAKTFLTSKNLNEYNKLLEKRKKVCEQMLITLHTYIKDCLSGTEPLDDDMDENSDTGRKIQSLGEEINQLKDKQDLIILENRL